MSVNLKVFIIFQLIAFVFYLMRYTSDFQWKLSNDLFTPTVCRHISYLGGTMLIIVGMAFMLKTTERTSALFVNHLTPIIAGVLLIIGTATGITDRFLNLFYGDEKRFKFYYHTMSTILAIFVSLIGFWILFAGEPLPE